MSVLVQTSYGDLTIDLNHQRCPTASKNFLKLCKIKHYNNALFMNVQKNYIARVQTKRPTTIFKEVYGEEDYQYFEDQVDLELKLNTVGLVCTANLGPNLNNSQFFITLSKDNLASLNGKHTVFGRVEQGIDVIKKINDSFVDQKGRPYMNVRILHTHILEDPFEDLEGMKAAYQSPQSQRDTERLEVIEHMEMTEKGRTEADIIKATKQQRAKKQAVTLEILGQLPDADAKPPENVLFICKLNPITEERDLQLIFSRFGPVKSCEIVRDWKTGQSLQYGFVEYENSACCEQAYLKMDNVLIDDRRIHVDFCQSVTKLWPKNKKQQKLPPKTSGEMREPRRPNDLVPKFREGRDYYGDFSKNYGIVTKQTEARQREDPPRESQPQRKRDIQPEPLRDVQPEAKREQPPAEQQRKRQRRDRSESRSPTPKQKRRSRSRSRTPKKDRKKKHRDDSPRRRSRSRDLSRSPRRKHRY